MECKKLVIVLLIIITLNAAYLISMGTSYEKLTKLYTKQGNNTAIIFDGNIQLVKQYNELVDKYNKHLDLNDPLRTRLRNLSHLERKDFGPNGIYYAGKFYCVYTGDRNMTAIASTENHEICHNLVYEYPKHFCENQTW